MTDAESSQRETMHTEPHDEVVAGPDATGHAADLAAHGDHAVTDQPLGPIDMPMWAAGLGGVAIGLVIALCFALATGYVQVF
ncbi:MAG: hypothetical protein ACJ761_01220 [Chloroflexota bacterium]